MEFQKIGTKKQEIGYDNKMHEMTLTDYLVKVFGNTFPIKGELHKIGCHYDGDEKAWFINISEENEINNFVKKIMGYSGVMVALKPIFRITN